MRYRVINETEPEYKKFQIVAKMLAYDSVHGAAYTVEDVYLDYGQDWMWTTICRVGYRECQVLSPREWEDIMNAQSLEELIKCVRDIQNGDYFMDK